MAPLILKASANASFNVGLCATGHHDEMLQQVLDFSGKMSELCSFN
ncbi:MAG: hypothetical protein QMC83_02755 [Thermodesulfovibrionales bacterium]|nr:hypothetical protein [Thermodesulfovibrionales bacterium]